MVEQILLYPIFAGELQLISAQAPGLPDRSIGQKYGHDDVTLNVGHLPPHNHPAMAQPTLANKQDVAGNIWAKDASPTTATYSDNLSGLQPKANEAIGNTGGGQSFSIDQPTLVINWCIALTGVFPSRN